MKNIYLLSNQTKTVVSPRTVGVSLPSRCRVLPILFIFLTLCCSSVWGDSYTITFKTGTGDGSAASTSTSVSNVISSGGDYVSGFATATKTYYAGNFGLKLGASSNSGSFQLTLSDDGKVKADSIKVNAKLYNSSKAATINVNSGTAQSVTSSFADYKFVIGSDIESITLASSKYLWVSSVSVYYTPTTTYTITPATSDGDMGTVSLTGSVITASPKSGYQVKESDPYTVTAGSATVTRGTGANINKFTVTPSSDCTVRINFEAIPTYAIRFFNNGTQVGSTQNLPAGATAVKPSDPAACDEGYTFVGWWTAELAEDNTTAETWITDFTVSGAQDYYAVFSVAGAGGGTKEFLFSDIATAEGWVAKTDNHYNITISPINILVTKGTSDYRGRWWSDNTWRIYSGNTVTISSSAGDVTSVSSSPSQTFDIDEGVATLSPSSTVKFTSITVNYGTTYYTTDCGSACSTPTLTLSNGGATVNKFVGDANFTITATPSNTTLPGGTVTYSSSLPSKASVDPATGEVTIHDAMSTTPVVITATLGKVTSGTECQKQVKASYTLNIYNRVTWLVNGAPYSEGTPTTEVTEGAKITTAPTDPDGSTTCGGKTFVGWTTSEVAVEQSSAPDPLYSSTSVKNVNITDNTIFHAVFATVGGESTDKYRKGTSSELTDGKRVLIVHHSSSNALSSEESGVGYAGVSVTPDGNGIITTTNSKIIWTAKPGASGCAFRQGDSYILADESSGGNHYLYFDDYADEWTITDGETAGTYILHSAIDVGYQFEYYSSKFQSFTGTSGTAYEMDFYVPTVGYTDYSTTCGPSIKANEVERLTSYKDQTVKSQAITVRGSSLDPATGTLTASITGTDAGLFSCTLASTAISEGAINTTFVISYRPTAFGDAQHTATLTFTDGTTTSDPITLRGRSLPQQFAIVAFDGANYYALNGSMSGLASMVKPLPVTVTAGAVDLCPNQAIYSLTERETPDKNVYLVGPGADGSGARLWGGSDTKLNTKSLTSTNQTGWLLTTSDFSTYHITNADVTTRGIMYYSTSDAFGHYATAQYGTANYYGDIQLLPITEVCTCLPAPFPTAVARATSVTITWGEVTGAVSYVVTCSGGSAPVYDGCKATITGLTNNTNYTYTVKAVASGNDCSLVYSGNFTTTDCDDVPYAISVAPALTSATFRWSMEAASATIRIYSDEECTAQVGSDHTGLTSPATITGLDENTTYYAKIWAGGTCVSAVTSFTTNSPSVELAEWFPDSIRIVLNADTANATVVIEDKNDLGDHATSVANDIFFSKYFEASGFTKLVGLYNGTDHDIDLAQLVIKGGESSWTTKKGVNNYIKLSDVSKLVTDYGDGAGHIYLPRGKEIILYSIQKSNKSGFTGAGCIDEYYDWDELADDNVADWYRIGGYESDVVDDDGHKTLNFPGKVSVSLWRNSTMIDLIGAGNSTAPTSSATTTVTTSHTLGNGRTISCPNDKPGFWSEEGWSPRPQKGDPDFALYPNGYSTYLTTNRCLLVRANHVVSGDSAILNNTSTFKTLGAYEGVDGKSHKAEWVGIPIGNDGTSDERDCLSGGQFGYVGAYDYNAYYATFDSIADLKELGGSQNPDGTYTIEIPHLDTLSCTSLKINVYEGSVVQASKTYQVPIMVTTEKAGGWSTTDTIFQNKWHDLEACEKCDVVILKGATLTKAENGLPKDAATVGNLTIYPGGTMNIPTSRTFNVASVQFRVEGENVPFIKLAGTLETADKQVLVSRRINNSDAYFFSLPYDCNISDIRWSNGVPAILDDGFRIKEYDSRARADEGSTKGAPGHWKMVTGSTLEAGKGYQISVNNRYLRELIFPLDLGKTNVSAAENEKNGAGKNVVSIHQYTNGATTINNHNWNFIAQPYLCAMSPMAGDAITYGYLEYEIEEVAGEQQVVWYRRMEGNQYLTIYDPSTRTYDQKFWSSVTQLDPFLAFFVQGKTEGSFTFTEGNRKNSAPARHVASQAEVDEDPSIFVGVTLSGNGLTDQANLRVRQDFTEDEYKLGYDLLKFTTYYKDRPQVYMKTPSYQLAFQAVSDSVAKNTWLPMGVYCYKPGTYTFGLSNDYPIDEVEAVYLYDKVAGVTTNLLYDTYTITTSSQLYTNTRFALNVIVNRREPQVTTDTGLPEAPDNMVRKILINGHVYIQRGAAIYDITGKQMLNF